MAVFNDRKTKGELACSTGEDGWQPGAPRSVRRARSFEKPESQTRVFIQHGDRGTTYRAVLVLHLQTHWPNLPQPRHLHQ